MDLCQLASTFAVVAGRAGSHHVGPNVLAPHMLRQDVIYRQIADVPPTVLTDIIIPPKNFAAGQFDMQAWAVDHLLQADNGRSRDGLLDGLDIAATIHHHVGLPREYQSNGATSVTDVDGLEIGIEY